MFELVWMHLAEVIALLVIAILVTVTAGLRRYIARRPPSLRRFNEASNSIHHMLVEARVLTRADRVFVIQFRNGQRFDIDAPVFRLYVTHEVVNRGISSITLAWSNMMASQFHEVLTPFFTGTVEQSAILPCANCQQRNRCEKRVVDAARLVPVRSLSEGIVKSMLVQQGTETLLAAPLLDRDVLVGLVVADYRRRVNETLDEQCDAICYAARNIAYELKNATAETNTWFARAWRRFWKR